MKIKTVFIITCSVLSATILSSTYACSSVAFSGSYVDGGGTIFGHNRDSTFNAFENLVMIKPEKGYPYLALKYGKGPDNLEYISCGTNQYGLSICANDPATNYPKHRNEDLIETKIIHTVLTQYKSIDELNKNAQKIFGVDNPGLFVLSDSKKVAEYQAGYDDKYGYRIETNGYLWDTNSFTYPAVDMQNKIVLTDVEDRDRNIKYFLNNLPLKVTFSTIYNFLGERNYGLFHSINREITLARYTQVGKLLIKCSSKYSF
ncbi:MAG: carcinine hydrolase/isopenicillin-N N-acyltransferase family protein, partial [Francisellaceae bacterium]